MSELEFEKKMEENERRFSQEQYEMLLRCSEKKDMTEWNEWRKGHSGEPILLEGADLSKCYLKGAYLNRGGLREETQTFSGELCLDGANFLDTCLEGAKLNSACVRNGNFRGACLEGAEMGCADIRGAIFHETDIRGVRFTGSLVDGSTLLSFCRIDENTDFCLVGLGSARIDVGTRQLLEYNVRRMNWGDWYKKHWFWQWPVRLFWAVSDYGMSTLRVVGVFFILALLFAAVYVNWAYWAPPGIVSNLVAQPGIGEGGWHYFSRVLIRPVYFSVVTMTTLGFGDMYANKESIAGHVLLILQVILGYVLLGALVTRFAVLFTAGGPAGKFAEEKKETPE